MSISLKQRSFQSGEWTPGLYGRNDVEGYAHANELVYNGYVTKYGGVSNRPGLRYVCEVHDSTSITRLVPFQYSVEQGYILEFSDTMLRFISDGVIVGGGTPVTVSTPYLEADLALLKFRQNTEQMVITHPSYPSRVLERTSHTVWTLSLIAFGTNQAAPTGLTSAGGVGSEYTVTAVNVLGEESLLPTSPSSVTGSAGNRISWTAASGAVYYNVYKDVSDSGVYGFLGVATDVNYTEVSTGLDPDYTKLPTVSNNTPFTGPDNYPGSAAFFEQRLVFSRTNNHPDTVWGTFPGTINNLNVSTPLTASSAYEYSIASVYMNEIRHLIPKQVMLLGTSGTEWQMSSGRDSNTVTALAVDLKQQSNWGMSNVAPVTIGGTVVFLENSDSVLRTFAYSDEGKRYVGRDISFLAEHLFKGKSITELSYQQAPESIIWGIRNDGKLLGVTYQEDYNVFAWHQHETNGLFKSIATLQNGAKDDTYVVVERVVNGTTKKYIEQFTDRLEPRDDGFVDIRDAFFVDSGLTLDDPKTITGITKAEPAVVTSEAHGFSNGDYVDIVEVKGMTEVNYYRFIVANQTANTFELTDMSGNDIDSTAYTTYISGGKARKAVTTITGLDHLEGETVTVLANGSVLPDKVVSSGEITMTMPASRVHVGLPYSMKVKTMNLEYSTKTGDTSDKAKTISSVVVKLRESRALYVGSTLENVNEVPFRSDERYGQPIELFSGDKEVSIEAGNVDESKLCFVCSDPLPVTILNFSARIVAGEI